LLDSERSTNYYENTRWVLLKTTSDWIRIYARPKKQKAPADGIHQAGAWFNQIEI